MLSFEIQAGIGAKSGECYDINSQGKRQRKAEFGPNPVKDKMRVWIENATNIHITIRNLQGQDVQSLESFNGAEFSTSSLRPGTYFLIIKAGEDVFYKRIIMK